MKRVKRQMLLALMVVVMTAINTPVYGESAREGQFFPLSEIQPKMKGIGYTVVAGTKIESFAVEVVGLLKNNGSVRRLILIKVSGRALESGGGISSGMSGSPIYFKNRLAGAISFGFQNADPYYALVTPIAEMMALWDYPQKTEAVYTFYRGGSPGISGVTFDHKNTDTSLLRAEPVSMPILINGQGNKIRRDRSSEYLSSVFAEKTIIPVFVGNADGIGEEKAPELRPGSAVSVILADGDYQVTALGTLTWAKNGRFLAFGHPFLNSGKVEYGFGGAYIHTVIASKVFPFKIGSGYPTSGRVTQDRGAGIAGDFGLLPEFVDVSIKVTDTDLKRTDTRSFRVIRDERLIPGLVLAGLLDAEDSILDRISPGTANVKLRVEGDNIDPIQRENIFYGQDVAAASLKEMDKILQLLTENKFAAILLSEISMEVEVTSERLSAELTGVDIPQTVFQPGEEFTLIGRILPYRSGREEEIPISIEIPVDCAPGEWLLSIRSGAYDMFWEAKKEKETSEVGLEDLLPPTVTSLDQLLSEFTSQPTNNRLVVEFLPLYQARGEEEGEEFYEMAPETQTPSETKKWTAETTYYLVGEEQLVINIVDPQVENEDGDQEFTDSLEDGEEEPSDSLGDGEQESSDSSEDER